ncbi:cob(I)yrinic acid a,c-diamide adenosyltransferase [Candidatus Dependentiae bacterium]|nr:cob(I)yrinic acid a,c-diamide adenosyltransferase [Candidatus Dependentiae bacterium]
MLYTRQGDQGTTTTLRSNDRIAKSTQLIEALGSVDELNSFIGLCAATSQRSHNGNFSHLTKSLQEVQHTLFVIQAELAGAPRKTLSQHHVDALENMIANLEKKLRPITSFIVAGGSELSALFDVTRTVARRAERALVRALMDDPSLVSQFTQAFMNRISSLFYVYARYVNQAEHIAEQAPRQPTLTQFLLPENE